MATTGDSTTSILGVDLRGTHTLFQTTVPTITIPNHPD